MTAVRPRGAGDPVQLPGRWLAQAQSLMPEVARDIIERIRTEIPEYGDDPSGQISGETRSAVREAVGMFMDALATGVRTGSAPVADARRAEVFTRLGRLEAQAGRSHDTLQSAYRIASQTVMQHLLTWESEHRAPHEAMAQLSSSVFAYIDDLARLSAEGFAEERRGHRDSAHARTRLLEMLLGRDTFSRRAVTSAAARVPWVLPATVSVIDVVPGQVASSQAASPDVPGLAAEVLGDEALCATFAGRWVAIVPGAVDLVALRERLSGAGRDLLLVVAPMAQLAEAAAAARVAARLRSLHDVRQRAVDGVVACVENMVDLVLDSGREAVRLVGGELLAPLEALTPAKRVKYGRLLSAWLEYGTLNADEPGVLDKHRQTLRYQCAQLERMFGDALTDRRSRLELMIALRSALPVWERQASARS